MPILRNAVIFLGLLLMLGCGVAIAAWPRGASVAQEQFTAQQLKSAYGRIRAGVTPVSQLAQLGLDTAGAAKLSYLGVMEQFMPRNSFNFDTLDAALQTCFEARDRCTAYVFTLPQTSSGRVVLLVEGGRVAYKMISGLGALTSGQATIRAGL